MSFLSLPGRKLTVNANGSFGPEFLGRHGEFNPLVTLPPHEILHLHHAISSHVCAVPLENGELCRRLLRCPLHSQQKKLSVERSKDYWVLLEEAMEDPGKAAHSRKMVRLYLDYQLFWKRNPGSIRPPCSRDSCESSSTLAPTKSLKLAYLRKISKELGSKLLDFVACVHYRLRSVDEAALRENQLRLELLDTEIEIS